MPPSPTSGEVHRLSARLKDLERSLGTRLIVLDEQGREPSGRPLDELDIPGILRHTGGVLLVDEGALDRVLARLAPDTGAGKEAVRLDRRAAEIQTLREVAIALSSSLDQRNVLRVACESGRQLLRADFAAALVPRDDSHWVEDADTASPGPGEALSAFFQRALPGIRFLATGQAPDLPLTTAYESEPAPWPRVRSGIAVPLWERSQLYGALVFGWTSASAPRGSRMRAAEILGAHTSLALRNARVYDDMRQAAERRDRFFSAMSHDLRTPITAIVGYSELLLDGVAGEIPARPREMVDRISQVAGHLSQLVNDILDLAKLEAGRMEFHREVVRLSDLLDDAIVAVEPQADSKGLALRRVLQDDGDTPVVLDRFRVRQVLVNLLSNAVKFTAAGEVCISAGVDLDRAWIAVRDTGPGIGDGDPEALFEEFLQVASGSGTKSEPGTGLGLAISRRLARAMNGDLTAENAPEGGALFTLFVPSQPQPDTR